MKDYGVRARRRLTAGQWVAFLGAVAAALGFIGWLVGGAYLRDRRAALELARDWTIEGPPCPSLTKAQFEARGLRAQKGVFYDGVTFYRRFGHMSCSPLRYGGGWGLSVYPVCQFTSPQALRVTTKKGEWFYALPPGQPATIATPHGQARCVQAANFNMKRLSGRGG
jgi:hypothetical protein